MANVKKTAAKKPAARKAPAKRPVVKSNPARNPTLKDAPVVAKAIAKLDKSAPKVAALKPEKPAKAPKVAAPKVAKPKAEKPAGEKKLTAKDKILELVKRPEGVNEAEVCTALGWKAAAVTMRRAFDGAGLKTKREKGEDGKFRYFAA
jgi:hypothetical protein